MGYGEDTVYGFGGRRTRENILGSIDRLTRQIAVDEARCQALAEDQDQGKGAVREFLAAWRADYPGFKVIPGYYDERRATANYTLVLSDRVWGALMALRGDQQVAMDLLGGEFGNAIRTAEAPAVKLRETCAVSPQRGMSMLVRHIQEVVDNAERYLAEDLVERASVELARTRAALAAAQQELREAEEAAEEAGR